MTERIVLIGAGSAMFTRGLLADIIRRNQPVELSLVDTDPAALEVAERLARKMVEARQAPVTVRASVERRDVLAGATAVICTVGVGGRRAWEQDVFIPRQYGIFQPVGDSVMPGGTSRALRMIPPMVAIARDVLELAPDALFFNYGNPMAPVCRAVRKATGANMIGLCHGVFHVGQFLARALGVEESCCKYTALGMNHLTWFTEVRVDGRDMLPRLREIAEEKLAHLSAAELGTGFAEDGSACRDNSDVTDILPFTWQLTRLFNAFPAVLDRHITEFFPAFFREGKYYGKTLGVDAFSFEGTIEEGDRIFAEMQSLAHAPGPLPEDFFTQLSGEHEQVIDIIDSIRTDAGRVYSANLPNQGQIPNIPPDAIVEGPCIADAGGIRPIAQAPLPSGIAGTLAGRLAWVETTVDAALEGRRDKFIQALVNDGSCGSLETATALADDLLKAQASYLPQFAKAVI
ncbi:MAG: family 4 glycosyl hydrolase [Armatimonadota bacterium]